MVSMIEQEKRDLDSSREKLLDLENLDIKKDKIYNNILELKYMLRDLKSEQVDEQFSHYNKDFDKKAK